MSHQPAECDACSPLSWLVIDCGIHNAGRRRLSLLAAAVNGREEQLTGEDAPYEVGMAYYREVARGQIRGDTAGRLKLIFHRDTRKVLGVHIIGEDASELVHIGQAVMALDGTIDYFVDAVFNYPTLAECYKVAAFNGLGRLHRYQAG